MDIHSNTGELLETISEKQFDQNYFFDKYKYSKWYPYLPLNRMHYRSDEDYEDIWQKIGRQSGREVREHNDYFAVVQDDNTTEKLFCFYLNDYIELNVPTDYLRIELPLDTNYAILSFEGNEVYSQIIDEKGNSRYIKKGYIYPFANNLIIIYCGNYYGVADLDGNWIIKTIQEDDI